MSLWTQRLRVQQECVKPEWASGLVPFHFSQVKLCVCICCIHTICLPVYYIRIGLEASENELACCHLLKKSFGTFREFQLPLLSLLQFLWLIESWLHAIFIFVEENWCLLFPAHHTGLVISMSQCRNPRGDSGTPELRQSKPDAALSWPCSFPTGHESGQDLSPYYHFSEFGVIAIPSRDIYIHMVRRAKRKKNKVGK